MNKLTTNCVLLSRWTNVHRFSVCHMFCNWFSIRTMRCACKRFKNATLTMCHVHCWANRWVLVRAHDEITPIREQITYKWSQKQFGFQYISAFSLSREGKKSSLLNETNYTQVYYAYRSFDQSITIKCVVWSCSTHRQMLVVYFKDRKKLKQHFSIVQRINSVLLSR